MFGGIEWTSADSAQPAKRPIQAAARSLIDLLGCQAGTSVLDEALAGICWFLQVPAGNQSSLRSCCHLNRQEIPEPPVHIVRP